MSQSQNNNSNNAKTNSNPLAINQNLIEIKNLSPLSQISQSNILYYQNQPSYYTSLSIISQLSHDSIDISKIHNISQNNSPNQEESTPKMCLNCPENQNNSENNQNNKEIIKNNLKSKINLTNEETNFSSFINQNYIIPTIQNIVSTANLDCELNLKAIALLLENAVYNPKRFSGLIMRIKEPKSTALIFNNGKMVVLGAKTEEDSKKASRRFAKTLKSLNFNVIFKNFRIQNIVASCDVKFEIRLNALNLYMTDKGKKAHPHYEPEVFPGLIYRYSDNNSNYNENNNKLNLVFLVFSSGKIVIAGAKSRDQIYNAFNEFYALLNNFNQSLKMKYLKK